jgi:TonB family protein
MNNHIGVLLVFLLTGFSTMRTAGQNLKDPGVLLQADSAYNRSGGTILDGMKYYIKLVPRDTTLDEKMPTYKPDGFVIVDQQPVPVNKVTPRTPQIHGHDTLIEGTAWIKCLVGKEGKVTKAEVTKTDSELLNKPAIEAARQWRFSPARLKGKPVEVWVVIPIRFGSKN